MHDSRLPKILLHAECDGGKRDVGSPVINFRKCVKKDLLLFNISTNKWQSLVYDRIQWRTIIFAGKNFFLMKWWGKWIKKHRSRQANDDYNNKPKSNSDINDVDLNHMLEKFLYTDKQILSLHKYPVIQNDVFIANPVQRKMQIHACLEELICLVEREQQFVVLEQAIVNGYVNADRIKSKQNRK